MRPTRLGVVGMGLIWSRVHEPHLARLQDVFELVAFCDVSTDRRAAIAADFPQARLVIVGEDRSWPPLSLDDVAARFGISSRVDFRSYVPDAELAGLYQKASIFAFLSEYEGFGFTPLEALSAGVPIVVADTAVAREVYGAAAHYVPVGDIAETTKTLAALLRDPRSADEVMRHAPEILARYSWDRAARETLCHIERIARH